MKPVSTRSAANSAGNRAGLRAGALTRRTRERMSRDLARRLAGDCAAERAIPEHWRPLFTRAFVKAALAAAHPNGPRLRTVTGSGEEVLDEPHRLNPKYGVA